MFLSEPIKYTLSIEKFYCFRKTGVIPVYHSDALLPACKSHSQCKTCLKEAFKILASLALQLVLSAVILWTSSYKYTDVDYHS